MTTPAITTPAITTPAITTPAITTPAITTLDSNGHADVGLARRTMSSPIGSLHVIASPAGIRAVLWRDDDAHGVTCGSGPILDTAERQLSEYFDGVRRTFDLPLDPIGTAFQRAAWLVLRSIPYGTTISYAEQARAMGDSRKARAVGGANGRNPIPIIVPCHRVIGSNGSLTGFAGGMDVKKYLLDLEGVELGHSPA